MSVDFRCDRFTLVGSEFRRISNGKLLAADSIIVPVH